MKVRKRVRDRAKKKGGGEFDQVREYTRMRRMSDERFLEAQDKSEFKGGKEKLYE